MTISLLGAISTVAIVGIVVGSIFLLILFWFVVTYNAFVKLSNNVDESFSAMDVAMKTRYDMIPNIVATVKGYAKHESQTLKDVIEARNSAITAKTSTDRMKAEGEISNTISKLFALAEQYPDLKANANYMDLQSKLEAVEHTIASSRNYYNANVKAYNIKLQSFPSNIVAGIKNYKKRELYEAANEQERQNVKVEF